MLRAGADQGATGENAVVVNAARADLILGPMGIVLCDALMGEITERMACAIGRSPAHKVLIPVSRCQVTVAGCERLPATEAVALAARKPRGASGRDSIRMRKHELIPLMIQNAENPFRR